MWKRSAQANLLCCCYISTAYQIDMLVTSIYKLLTFPNLRHLREYKLSFNKFELLEYGIVSEYVLNTWMLFTCVQECFDSPHAKSSALITLWFKNVRLDFVVIDICKWKVAWPSSQGCQCEKCEEKKEEEEEEEKKETASCCCCCFFFFKFQKFKLSSPYLDSAWNFVYIWVQQALGIGPVVLGTKHLEQLNMWNSDKMVSNFNLL